MKPVGFGRVDHRLGATEPSVVTKTTCSVRPPNSRACILGLAEAAEMGGDALGILRRGERAELDGDRLACGVAAAICAALRVAAAVSAVVRSWLESSAAAARARVGGGVSA